MSNKARFAVKKFPSSEMALQITSMADIFIIILVFLLKSYAEGAMAVAPGAGLLLPIASAEGAEVQALAVEVSEHAALIDSRPVCELARFRFRPEDLGKDGIPAALDAAIKKRRERQDLIAKANSDVKVDPKILVVADKRVPYSTLKTVLATAAIHGFTDFKLVVAKK